MPETHEEIVKVWIAPGCIVCDACETDCPEVFDVQEETCLIRPEAKDPAFTKALTPSIIVASEGCPVEVIKYETVQVEGPAPWAGKEEEQKKAATAGAGAGKGGGGGAPAGGWSPPEGPPNPKWAGLLSDSHTSGSRSAGGPAVTVRKAARAPAEAVATALPRNAAPDAMSAAAVGTGLTRPRASATERIRERAAKLAGAAKVTRRGFSFALALGWTSMALAAAAFGGLLQSFMVPKVTKEPPSTFRVGKLSDFSEPGVYLQNKDKGVWIVHLPTTGELIALSTTCTHLGCIPNWLPGDQKFKCPCHGSGFYITGVNFEGPAPRPLERMKIYKDGEFVMVDKSIHFRQELGQWGLNGSFIAV
jgi:cytochrome b6-f complex iron-sulfur subunit